MLSNYTFFLFFTTFFHLKATFLLIVRYIQKRYTIINKPYKIMKKLGISISFFLLSICFANAQFFNNEDSKKKKLTIEHEERTPHFPGSEMSKLEEDSLRLLFSEESFKYIREKNNNIDAIIPLKNSLDVKPKKQ